MRLTLTSISIISAFLMLMISACSDDSALIVIPDPVPDPDPPACPVLSDYMRTIATFDTDGDALGVASEGDIIFVADGTNGLVAIDFVDLTTPVVVSTLDLTNAVDIQIHNSTAVIAAGDGGIVIVDVRDASSPIIQSTISTPGFVGDIEIAGTTVFAADDELGLMIFDISDPIIPMTQGIENTPGTAVRVAVSGDVAYVADRDLGIRVVSVQDPDAPWLITTFSAAGQSQDVAVAGKFLYIADGAAGVQVVDISDPTSPAIIGNVVTRGAALDVDVRDDVVYVAVRNDGLQSVDVSDPTSPMLVGTIAVEGETKRVVESAGRVLCADGTSGVRVVDATDPTTVPVASEFIVPGARLFGALYQSDKLFIADSNNGVHIAVSEGDGIAIEETIAVPGSPTDVVWYEGFLYVVAGSANVLAVDVFAPKGPTVVRSIPGSSGSVGITFQDSVVFMARGFSPPTAFDLKTNALPITFSVSSSLLNAVDTGLQFAYFSAVNGRIWVIDLNLNSPNSVRSAFPPTGKPRHVVVRDGFLYVANASGSQDTRTGIWSSAGVDVFSLSNALFPTLVRVVETSVAAEKIVFDGDMMYVAGGFDGMEVIDMSDPLRPVHVGSYSPDDRVHDVVHIRGSLHVISEAGTITSLLPDCPTP